MTDVVLTLEGVVKNFGQTQIIRGVTLDVLRGERHALIGPNGAGKSTLFNLVSGRLPASAGTIRLDGKRIDGKRPEAINRMGLARSFQITNVFTGLSVFENLRSALLWPRGRRYGLFSLVDKDKALNDEARLWAARLGLEQRLDETAGRLAYAEQRALELGMTVAGGAPVVLLDEPLAGMNRQEVERFVALVREVTAGRTLLLIEHDMGVIFDLADRISVLVYGEIIATGEPAAIRSNARVQEAYLGHVAA